MFSKVFFSWVVESLDYVAESYYHGNQEKMLVFSIFSPFPWCFLPFQRQVHYFCQIQSVVCKCLQYRCPKILQSSDRNELKDMIPLGSIWRIASTQDDNGLTPTFIRGNIIESWMWQLTYNCECKNEMLSQDYPNTLQDKHISFLQWINFSTKKASK